MFGSCQAPPPPPPNGCSRTRVCTCWSQNMHQGCQHPQRLQLAAAEPGCARVGPRTCLCSTEADKCLGPVKPHHHRLQVAAWSQNMHQRCQHHHRLQLAAAEPRWARVSPRTCIRDVNTTTASTPGRKRLPSPCYEVNAETDSFQKNSTSSGNIQLATKSTSTLNHTRSIAHPQEHHESSWL